jgi:alpha-L-fucosidase
VALLIDMRADDEAATKADLQLLFEQLSEKQPQCLVWKTAVVHGTLVTVLRATSEFVVCRPAATRRSTSRVDRHVGRGCMAGRTPRTGAASGRGVSG